MSKMVDISFQRFGRWFTIGPTSKQGTQYKWLCLCDCGNVRAIAIGCLRAGKSRSCGCLKNDVTAARMYIHGKHRSPEHSVWAGMWQRCDNKRNPGYADYGARGITVCDRWRDFELFLADMGTRPSLHHSIERVNNNDGYNPANCIWATKIQQCSNTRRNVIITWRGETKCLTEWVRVLGQNYERVRGRMRLGWPFEKAIST